MKNTLEEKNDEIWVCKFDEDSAQKFRKEVVELSKMDPKRPITVYIDSYGGSVDALAKMVETMDEVPNPIITSCVGKAMSCGAMLLSHGDLRFCGKHSRIMIHEVSGGTLGDVHDMHADVQEAKRLNEYFMGILARNCGLKSYSELRKLIKEQDGRDRYMDAGDAVKFGIVDAVGTPKTHSAALYEVQATPIKPSSRDTKKSKKTKSESNRRKRNR